MHQTKKGNQWYFGIDSRSKLIHAAVATPANVADSTVLPELLHGNETRVWGDQAYPGQRAVIRRHAPRAQDFVNRRYRHRGIVDEVERAKKPHQIESAGQSGASDRGYQRVFGFAKVRYRGLIKNAHRLIVTCAKVRYRGLIKNAHRLIVTCALANLFIARRHLFRCQEA